MAVLFPAEGPNQFVAMAGVGQQRPNPWGGTSDR
jgi:hypothetical protein